MEDGVKMNRPKETVVLDALQDVELAIEIIEGLEMGLRGVGKWPFGAPLKEHEQAECEDGFREAGALVSGAWKRGVSEFCAPPAIPSVYQSGQSFQNSIKDWHTDLHGAKARLWSQLEPPKGWADEDIAFATLPRWKDEYGLQARLLIRDYPGITFQGNPISEYPPGDPRNYGIARLFGIPEEKKAPREARYLGWLCRGSDQRKPPNPSKFSGYQSGRGYFMNREAASVWNRTSNNPDLAMTHYHEWLESLMLPYGYEGKLNQSLIERAIDQDE